MKLEGVPFVNSRTCHGVTFTADAPLDMAEITITGRYPESGWARNRECHEMVRIVYGAGSLELRGDKTVQLVNDDVVHVPPGTWFAWSGDMTITMACSPAFHPQQYEIGEEDPNAILEDYGVLERRIDDEI